MSWSPVVLSASIKHNSKPAVRVGCIRAGGRFQQAMMVTIDCSVIDTPPEWLKIGQRVDVLLGHGEHAGWIRLVPGNQVAISTPGGKNARSSLLLLRLPGFPGLPPAACKTIEAEFDHSDSWIEIKLPGWFAAKAPVVAAPAAAPVTRSNGLALARQSHTFPKGAVA